LMEVSAVCGGFLLLQYLLKVALEMRLSALSMLGVGALSAAGSSRGAETNCCSVRGEH
jgi:hypothetical protein